MVGVWTGGYIRSGRQESPSIIIVICSERREQVGEKPERCRYALEKRGMKQSVETRQDPCVHERKISEQ